MRPKNITLDVADESTTGFASNVTGDTFALTATACTDGLAHKVTITNDTANDHSGKTITLVGLDQDGKAQTEELAGPGGSATVTSTKYFSSLTSVTPSATIGADTFDIGWADEVASKTIPLDYYSAAGAGMAAAVTGTLSFTVQETFDNIQASAEASQSANWHDITALAAKSASTVGAASVGATAVRVVLNSYSSGAALSVGVTQASAR